ncbi:cytochrome P450 [Ulvibacterium sp.]|uniref:cytochrome P450 n=1 Tax=Ulvibacterium sp. TaxID=2665914 RepID=UPI00260E92A5|nr:cytochrome P450 [Ulvibacterium sp.]
MKDLPSIPRYEVLRNRRTILKNPLPFHHHYFQKYGDTFRINLGRRNDWVFTRNAESIRHILQKNHKNYGKSSLQTKELAKYIGHGLLTSNGEFWRVHRRMIQPAFHKKKLEGLIRMMYKAIVTELKEVKVNAEQDIFPLMGDLAFQVVAKSLFSADNIRDRMQRLKEITIANQKMLIKEMRMPYLKWWFHLNGDIQKHLRLAVRARNLINGIVQERLDSKEEKDDLLDMLLSARYEDGKPMPRQQLIDEVMVLFTAGHETTANALSFTLMLLARHPEVQQRLYQEVKDIDFERGNSILALTQLPYTQQCLEESMRLYPPVYFMDRVSLAEDTLEGHVFKTGTVWLMSIYELHRHVDFWEDPDHFVPERFVADGKRDFSGQYFPFGAGPRMCVGNNFAMYEMLMTIAFLVRKYQLSTTREIKVHPLISLKPSEAFVKFTARI